jgi:hypothetical protein
MMVVRRGEKFRTVDVELTESCQYVLPFGAPPIDLRISVREDFRTVKFRKERARRAKYAPALGPRCR